MDVRVGSWRLSTENWCFQLWCWRRLLRVPCTARRPNQSILKKINHECSLEELMLSFNSLATWYKEPNDWKRPWCWERLRAGEQNDREWGDWMASLTQQTWVWANSERLWRTEKPGMLQPMGSQSDMTWWLNNNKMRTYCIAQGALLNVLWWSEWEENPKGGDICICMADSFHCTVETSTTL